MDTADCIKSDLQRKLSTKSRVENFKNLNFGSEEIVCKVRKMLYLQKRLVPLKRN